MRGLYALKPWYARRLAGLVRTAVRHDISPDLFTAAGVLAALGATVALANGWWLIAGILLAVRLAGANLDGAVARARGVSRPWGFVLNEFGDRAGDFALFGGLALLAAHLNPTVVTLVLLAAIAATLPTFVALSAAGAGGTRRNGGPMGKTERCALAVLACAWPALLSAIAVVIIVGSLATATVRALQAHRELTTTRPAIWDETPIRAELTSATRIGASA